MGKEKTVLTFYTAWNYVREIDDLNRRSGEGWQLLRGGSFTSRLVENRDIQYRYQLDFEKVADLPRYIETFREQGWEYINSTFNGWHYFRKPYDPSLPAEEYEIYTDSGSLREMKARWAQIGLVFGITLAIFTAFFVFMTIRETTLPHLIMTFIMALEAVIMLRGAFLMRRSEAYRSGRLGYAVFLILLVAGLISSSALTEARPHFYAESHAEEARAASEVEWTDFDIRYTDRYYVKTSIRSEKPLTLSIVDENGVEVYSATGTLLREERDAIRLKKGHYRVLEKRGDSGFDFAFSVR